jgi:divalent metal cation (Fe/Co/Zn/Cd) transporter
MKVARERKSSVLASNAVHHRVDSWTGIVTLLVILGANFLKDAAWLDPVGGLLISLLVIKAGVENSISALHELADRSIEDEVKSSTRKHILASLTESGKNHDVELRDISGIKSGQNYLLDIELAVPGGWSVEAIREVEEAVRDRVGSKVHGARRVRVRYVPKEATITRKFEEFIPRDVSERAALEEEEDHGHDHDHENGHNHTNGNGHHKHH